MPDGLMITSTPALDQEQRAAVQELLDSAAAVDGFRAVNEAAGLRLVHPGDGVGHLLVPSTGSGLAGYAQLNPEGDTVTGSLVVAPDRRRRGIGGALLRQLQAAAGSRLRIWATGDRPAAQALAAAYGFVVLRRLLIMDRDLDGSWPAAPPPAGITIRPFRPGTDAEAWLAVNARAFAHHPEQGALGPADLAVRLDQPWFDPAGFLLAERFGVPAGAGGPRGAGELVGFHWTKRHPDRLGEVYVIGVDPASGLRGLGRPLLVAGLDHLRTVGDERVQLYVESDNQAALRLYERSGFHRASANAMYGQAP